MVQKNGIEQASRSRQMLTLCWGMLGKKKKQNKKWEVALVLIMNILFSTG